MKTINLSLENECFDYKKKLPPEYTWRRLLRLGVEAAIKQIQKREYYKRCGQLDDKY